MVFGRGYATSKAVRKKMERANELKEKAAKAKERDAKLEANEAARAAKKKPMEVNWPKEGFGKHHCGHKDGGKSHAMSQECFRKEHMGICRHCHRPACARTGCNPCKEKGLDKDLAFDGFSFPGNS